jgi:membrane fusion protein (multidrug efflux system)
MEKSKSEEPQKKNAFLKYIPLILVVVIVLAACWFWYKDFSKYITTDDAFVDADKVSVSSKILGRISKIYVNEGDSVKSGVLLAELDSAELFSQKNQLQSLKKQAIANKGQIESKYQFDQENIKVFEINVEKTQDDLTRAKAQFDGGVMTREQYEHAQKAYQSAKAQYDAAKMQLTVSKSQIAAAQATVESSSAQIDVTETQLRNVKLYAPITGVIAKRWLLPGDVVQPGQSIFTIINDREQWISIYIEETNLSDLKIGQKANYSIDAFPDLKFSGQLFFIGSNTASQFALIPPSNASGNFTKITQRIPIKISIDQVTDNKGNKVSAKLLSGMSAVVKIIK